MKSQPDGLPVTRSLTLASVLSLVVAVLVALASAAGLLNPSLVYPADELRLSFVSNDVVNLVVGLPALIGSMWLARRGKLVGLLLWPGALFYAVYNYIAYLFGVPFIVLYPVYLIIFTLGVYTTIILMASTDARAVGRQLRGAVPDRLAGGVITGLGILFLFRAVGVIASALVSQTPGGPPDLPVLIADFFTTGAWILGGILLWRREDLGYVAGLGLLFQASTLFLGLILFLVIQPLMTAAPFSLTDIVVVIIMGLPCFIPFTLFLRGVGGRRHHPGSAET